MIERNEELFNNLLMYHNIESEYTKQLINEKWITNDYGLTTKAEEFVNEFYESKKMIVYNAIKEFGGYQAYIPCLIKKAEISRFPTLNHIIQKLGYERLVKCKENGDYEAI